MQTAQARPHHKLKTTSNITRGLALCKVISESWIFENIINPLLVGGLLLVGGFWYLFTPLFGGM